MTATVAGMYKEGKLELLEIPKGLREGRVRVVLTEEAKTEEPKEATPQYLVRGKYKEESPQYLSFGMFKGEIDTPLEAFKEAEWHGEEEFDDLYGD